MSKETDLDSGFVMRVPADGAALQFFTEAMRANTETLKQVNTVALGLQSELREVAKTVQDVRERVIKIEGSDLKEDVGEIKDSLKEVNRQIRQLENSKLTLEAQMSAGQWVLKNLPSIASILAFLGLITFVALRAAGRV